MDDTEIFWDAPIMGHNVITTRDTHFHVDLCFSCDLLEFDYYHDVLLRQNVRPSSTHKSVHIDMEQFVNPEVSRRIIAEGVGDCPVLDDHHRRQLINLAFNTTKNFVRRLPPYHNVLVIPFHLVAIRRRVVDVNRAMELVSQISMEEANSGMVPATDSSIESLEIKTTTTSHENDHGICSVCLEDFDAGCEALSMPCSHIFHKNCIKKWLKSSHYCPLCRHEMPTT